MKRTETNLTGLYVLEPKVSLDHRGFFMEIFKEDVFRDAGLPARFVQDNQSRSKRGVIRAFHFQYDPPMGKLMRVGQGEAVVVAVDIRKKSPTFRQWFSVTLSDENKKMLYLSPGFAVGFCALSDVVDMNYKFTSLYNAAGEANFRWNDPDIGVVWPTTDPILSDRDRTAPSLAQWLQRPESDLFE